MTAATAAPSTDPTTSGAATPPARAGRREWIALFVLAIPTLLLSIDMSVLYLALPDMSAQLHPSGTEQLWIIDVYGFMVAGFLVTMGTLGDRIGRRRLLLIGALGFAAASTAAAFATSPEMLIAARAVMGVTGATLMPSTLALISTLFTDPTQRGGAVAIWMSCFMGGMVVGPLVGGIMLEHFWWGSVFLLALPVMALLFAVAPSLLPEHKDPDAGRIDPPSVVLSLLAILPLIFALKEAARHGVHVSTVAVAVVGVSAAIVFVRRQRRLVHPLLDLTLFARPAFRTAIAINVGGGMVMAGSFYLISQYLQLVLGRDPLHAGIWLVPGQLVMIAASLITPRLGARFGRRPVIVGGLLLAASGFALLTRLSAPSDGGPSSPLPLLAVFALCAVGIAAPMALVIDLVLGSVPPARAGAASAASETAGEFGMAFGIAAFGSIGAAIYRSGLDLPASLPAGAAAAVRENLGAAVANLGAHRDRAGLLDTARSAFTHGIAVVAVLGVLAFLVMALVAVRGFRGVDRRPTTHPTADPAVHPAAHPAEAVRAAA